LLAATAERDTATQNMLARARTFAAPLIAGEQLPSGENTLVHADAVAAIVAHIGGSEAMQAASYLVYACAHLNKPQEVIAKVFGDNFAQLAIETTKLIDVQAQARSATGARYLAGNTGAQTENVRKMLLAFSRDLRVVLLRLASRLQTLRYAATVKRQLPESVARESLQVFAPLANRLGIWELKWAIEDLSFRFIEPETYKRIAGLLDEKRVERETRVQTLATRLQQALRAEGIAADVQGRPKNIYSIVKKMRGKSLDFNQVYDILALRVIVPEIKDCYTTLAWVHTHFQPIEAEFDDYIARPKSNGYRSLHTVVREVTQGHGQPGQPLSKPIEIQIRTRAMHEHAEHGVAAHWAYKEAGAKGYAGVWASGEYDAKIAVLRQLFAWERDLSGGEQGKGLFDDRIYVLTPDATIVELAQGATPIDFAYTVHTNLGHRCRGTRIDGAMAPLNTPLRNGQTVEIIAAKEGGPSRDWLNPELGYLVGARARAKVRAWFNAQIAHEAIARGREMVEKLLQREGKTAIKLEDLAARLGFKSADALFEVVGKDEFSLRNIETLLRPAPANTAAPNEGVLIKRTRNGDPGARGGVLVVGMSSLMTQLARCCRPAPPDAIGGFVTRGHGVSVHRSECSSLHMLAARDPERLIEVQWSQSAEAGTLAYAVDVSVQASDRQGLLRDISDVFAREKMNVIGVQSETVKNIAWMTFTVEISDTQWLGQVISQVKAVPGVRNARRR
jgi:GTP pyrophosphokinase